MKLSELRDAMEADAIAALEQTEIGRAALADLARAQVMSSSPGRTQCVYCGRPDYEPGWGCHTCGTGEAS